MKKFRFYIYLAFLVLILVNGWFFISVRRAAGTLKFSDIVVCAAICTACIVFTAKKL